MWIPRPSAIACGLLAFAIAWPALAASVDWTGCTVPKFGGDRKKVIEACSAVLNRADLSDTDRERALITRGRAQHMEKAFDAAIGDFDEAIKLAPRDPEPLVRRASATYAKSDFAGALVLAKQALEIDPNYPLGLDTFGAIAMRVGGYALAKAAFDKAIALDPNEVGARYHRVQYWTAIGAQRESVQELDDLLALKTSDLDTRFTTFRRKDISFRMMARLDRANILEGMARLPEALKAFDDFVQSDPGAFSYGWRGAYHIRRSEFDLAKADLEKALSYDPDYFVLYQFQGTLFFYAQEYERAVAAYSRAIELSPDEPGPPYWWRGLSLRALHRPEQARQDALKAFAADPDFLRSKLKMFQARGYWQAPQTEADLGAAVHDAALACMADEECW